MPNYVELDKEELKTFRNDLQNAFNIFCGKPMKLTGYKYSKDYEKLIGAIKKATDVTLSEPTLRDLITLKHKGKFRHDTFEAIDKFIKTYTGLPRTLDDKLYVEPVAQKVFWSVNQGYKSGLFINSFQGQFIEWEKIKEELETKVITQCPRIIPVGSSIELETFYGKNDWLIRIVDLENNKIGSVWIGSDPDNNWKQDGLVRIGTYVSGFKWKVWQILQRYSDGSYRIVKSFV